MTGSALNLGYFVSLVKRDHPEWPRLAVQWQAQRMMDRHPKLLAAYDAGVAQGRDLRQRMEHGIGVMWPELEALTPEERGFVLALVRAEIGVAKADGVTLEAVHATQEAEQWEEQQDALAADWREKSDAPDTRVKHVKPL